MGTDDLFHKRKARGAKDLKRRKARREPFAKVLVVCEGEKTEPHYFNGLKDHYRLNSANVEVCADGGSDPLGIYTFALERYEQERAAGDPFDKVFCVFDKDNHTNFSQAMDAIRDAEPRNIFVAVPSVPCFEFWFLLHYKYTTRPFTALSGASACDQVLAELRTFLPRYDKGTANMFPIHFNRLETAKKNAVRAAKSAVESGTDNPTTGVHELVSFLQDIKK